LFFLGYRISVILIFYY